MLDLPVVNQTVQLAVYLTVQLTVHSAVYLTVQLTVQLAVYLTVHLTVHLSVPRSNRSTAQRGSHWSDALDFHEHQNLQFSDKKAKEEEL